MRIYSDEEFEAKLATERARVIHAVLDELDAFNKTAGGAAFYSVLHARIVGLLHTLAPEEVRPPPVKPDDGRGTV